MKCCFRPPTAYTGLAVFPFVKSKIWVCDNCKSILCPCGCKKAYKTIDKFKKHIDKLPDNDFRRLLKFQVDKAEL